MVNHLPTTISMFSRVHRIILRIRTTASHRLNLRGRWPSKIVQDWTVRFEAHSEEDIPVLQGRGNILPSNSCHPCIAISKFGPNVVWKFWGLCLSVTSILAGYKELFRSADKHMDAEGQADSHTSHSSTLNIERVSWRHLQEYTYWCANLILEDKIIIDQALYHILHRLADNSLLWS